jgi:hypothetical protein
MARIQCAASFAAAPSPLSRMEAPRRSHTGPRPDQALPGIIGGEIDHGLELISCMPANTTGGGLWIFTKAANRHFAK